MTAPLTSNPKIQRYSFTRMGEGYQAGYIGQHPTGEFVHFTDYDTREGDLLAQIDRLTAEQDWLSEFANGFAKLAHAYRAALERIKAYGAFCAVRDNESPDEGPYYTIASEALRARLRSAENKPAGHADKSTGDA